jgi:glutamate-ammonia-ligase adenylyltransferase
MIGFDRRLPDLPDNGGSMGIRDPEGVEVDSRYADLLDEVAGPGDLAVRWQALGGGQWQVAVATTDKDGLLTVIAGLLTARGANIRSGDLLTLPAAAGTRLRKVLDVFRLALTGSGEEEAALEGYAQELQQCNEKLAAEGIETVRDTVIERAAVRFEGRPAARKQLLPVEIVIDNDRSAADTLLRITSRDIPGFLFAFANALSLLEINIEQATIRTEDETVHDTFWIRDLHGRKITDEDRLRELRFACALIKQFAHLLPHSPNPGQAIRQFRDLASRLLARPELAADFASVQSADTMQTLAELMGVSRFLWEDFLRMQHENLFPLIRNRTEIEKPLDPSRLAAELRQSLAACTDLEEQVQQLNAFKDREMFRIDLRHITRIIGDIIFARELSALTDLVVNEAARLCHARLAQRYGMPRVADRPCRWGILAAGKYGGREMGFASDLELLFVFEGEGETNGLKTVANSQYFEEFVQTFLKTLQSRKEGIFEIDLRLRPFGSKGTLASSLVAFGDYYAPDGMAEPFERMAMVKLRPVAGDEALLERVLTLRDGFVYSDRPLDLEKVLYLRRRMAEELVAAGTVNLKYSTGALVDIEFFLQALQIAHGARHPALRVTNTMQALKRLEEAGLVEAALAAELRRAYRCFRRVIDALRAVRGNARDLTLPDPESADFRYLSRRLGFAAPADCLREIQWSRELSRGLWERLK